MKMTAFFRLLIVAVLILSTVLVSCGGGGDQSTTASQKDVTTEAPNIEATTVGDVVEFPEIPLD